MLLGGSGGPYSEAYQQSFQDKKQSLTAIYEAKSQSVKVLSDGAIAEAWKIPYGSIDKLSVAIATRTLLAIENEFKKEADLLLMPIMAEATSKAAVTEIGLLLLRALTTGQDIQIFIEPFDPVDYVRSKLQNVELAKCTTEKQGRGALQQAGVSSSILAMATQSEVTRTLEVFKQLMRAEDGPDFKQIQRSLLGQTRAFHNADNARRVRALVTAHLDRLKADKRFAGLFSYSNRIEPVFLPKF